MKLRNISRPFTGLAIKYSLKCSYRTPHIFFLVVCRTPPCSLGVQCCLYFDTHGHVRRVKGFLKSKKLSFLDALFNSTNVTEHEFIFYTHEVKSYHALIEFTFVQAFIQ